MSFKRTLTLSLVLCLAAAIAGCTEAGGSDASSALSSAEASSAAEPASSAETASTASSVDPSVFYDANGWYDVDGAFQASGFTLNHDATFCFPEDAKGYTINGGSTLQPYLVDKATLRRLTTTPCKGTGYVKWMGFNTKANVSGTVDAFDGVAPAARLNDPVFMAACLPSEANTFMSERVNAGNHFPVSDDQAYIVAIGAIYRNEDNKPADDDAVTVCLSDFTLLLHTQQHGWFLADRVAALPSENARQMYYLPWSLQKTLGNYKLPLDSIGRFEDRVEVPLTGANFNGTAYNNSQIKEACFHFWANNKFFKTNFSLTGGQIDGVVVAYRAWVKEADASGKYVAAVASDIKNNAAAKHNHQVFAGYNHLLTNQPRWILGHNVGPKNYDRILTPADSAEIQSLIGLK